MLQNTDLKTTMSNLSDLWLRKVLVLEDEPMLCESIVDALSDRAEEIRSCNCVEQARSVINEWNPTLMIFDVMLPDGNSIDLLKELQKESPIATTIVMSAYANRNQCFELGALGARVYLQKPFSMDELNAAVDETISTVIEEGFDLDAMENDRRYKILLQAMNICDNNITKAAQLLGISRQLLQYNLKKYGIEIPKK